MRVIGAKRVERHDGHEWWLCVIVHDQELDKYDLNGSDVDGMNDDDLIAAGSLIATPTANYIAFTDGIFTQSELATGSGGGGGTPGTGEVLSWNSRKGNVYPRKGDYNASQILTNVSGEDVQIVLDKLQAAVELDPSLSTSSTKGVQNQAVAIAINQLRGQTLPPGGQAGDILAKVDNNNYNAQWINGSNFMRKSEYDTDNNGRVDKADVAYALGNSGTYTAQLKNISGNTYVLTELDKAKANGVVPLDNNRKILPEFLPDNVYGGMTYGGIFNATTRVVRLTAQAKSILGISDDTMTLQNSSTVPEGYPANVELYYVTKTAGTFAGMDFGVGDWLISIGTEWQQLIFGNKVSSVNNQTGAVELNSDEVPEGNFNLYMTPTEKAKLAGIEDQATRDVNVVQTAQIIEDTEGNKFLRLTNKNGNVVEFQGGGTSDLTEYLKKNGNGSQVYAQYTKAQQAKPTFSGNETEAIFRGKVQAWLDALDNEVINWADIENRPTRLSQFTNDGNGSSAYPFITKQVTDLQNYYKKTDTYNKTEVDELLAALQGMNFVEVDTLPTEDIQNNVIYIVPKTGGGYTRWWHSDAKGWLNFGDTDVNLTEYLKKDGDGSQVTVDIDTTQEKIMPESGDTLAVAWGKLVAYLTDIKTVAYTNTAESLDDYADLALKEDLENYVEKQQEVTDAGKLLGIDEEGKVKPVSVAAGVMRRGEGTLSMVGNDTEEDKRNAAAGSRATAIGNGTIATSDDQVAEGRYNVEDANGTYAHIIGGGSPTERKNIATIDWGGNGWVNGKISVGNTTDNIIEPTAGNDLTPKNYVDKYVDEEIAKANLLKSMVVQEVPDVDDADANILYLLKDPTAEDVYLQYKKVLESQNPDVYIMAKLGSTQITSSDTQVQVLPTPSAAFDGMVYQYVGSGANHDFGFFYACRSVQYYAWLSTDDAKYYYTLSATPSKWGKIFDENMAPIAASVDTVAENTLTDNAGKTYTRLTAQDTSRYEWVELNKKLSEYTNDGSGTGAPNDYFVTRANALTKQEDITEVTDTTTVSKVVPETGDVSDVTAKKIFEYMWKKIYPVGSIYTTVSQDNPGTLFGGTWTLVGTDRVLWGVAQTTAAGGTLDEQLPDIRGHIDWATGGQAKTEISSGSGAFNLTNKNLGAAYPTGTGASNSARGFDFRASYYSSVYKLNASVRPAAYTVHFWRRTA